MAKTQSWQLLGWLGVIPFVACLVLAMMSISFGSVSALQVFIVYSACICSFVAGSLWMKTSEATPTINYISNVITLIAFTAVLLPPTMSLMLLSFCYAALMECERYFKLYNDKPEGYQQMRKRITIILIFGHVALLAVVQQALTLPSISYRASVTTMTSLTIFYDGQCPLCTREINALRARDNKAAMTFEDLHQMELAEKYPMIQKDQAFQMIHGLLDGKVIKGIDVNYHAWRLVGKEAWVAPLRWRLTRPLAQLGYRLFARYRHQISSVYSKITGDDCACATNISKPKSKQHSKE